MPSPEYFLKNPIKKIYEDEQYIVFDKPAGLLVIPTAANEPNTLVNIVNRQYASGAQERKLHPCHRLDRETSGVILFALGKHFQQAMMEAFKNRSVKKVYTAFVHGRLRKASGELRGAVKDLDERKFRRQAEAKFAVTRFHVREYHREFSVAAVEPVTGRTNQIRIQFAAIGHPLVGDRKYAFARDYSLKFRRTALHAARLEWYHPVSRCLVRVESPLPKDMREFLQKNA